MPTTYVVFHLRKKRPEETLREYTESTVLGTVSAVDPPKAITLGAQTFHVEQHTVDVVALNRAGVLQKDSIHQRGAWKPREMKQNGRKSHGQRQ
jgi:hypothetical protein